MATFGDSPGEINVGAEATPVYRSQCPVLGPFLIEMQPTTSAMATAFW
jgi:hypothetical protein